MRMSHQKRHELKDSVLKDLYDEPMQKIADKKGALV